MWVSIKITNCSYFSIKEGKQVDSTTYYMATATYGHVRVGTGMLSA